MRRRLTDAHGKIIDAIADAMAALAGDGLPFDAGDFARHYYRNVAAEDLVARSAGDLAGAAWSHLQFAMQRRRGRPKVRVFNPENNAAAWNSTHTIVQTVNDDMPFLVDSVAMLLNAAGFTVHLTVHPILNLRRDGQGNLVALEKEADEAAGIFAESLIMIEVDRETDPQILTRLEKRIRSGLRDVRSAVRDWAKMRNRLLEICAGLRRNPPPLDAETVDESLSFLEWMEQDHFTFLGFREYDLIETENDRYLRAIVGSGLGILRRGSTKTTDESTPGLTQSIRPQSRASELLVITKASSNSTVHRPTNLDYVGIKRFDENGKIIGEQRFLGLYTSTAYSRNPRQIPLLRYKTAKVLELSGLGRSSHGGKALVHVLDNYPRDELFQISIEDLARIARGILDLQERQRVKLFVRRDEFRRFISCLVFVPRDKYSTQVRERIERILLDACNGRKTEHTVQLADSKLARVHIIVWLKPGSAPRIAIGSLEKRIAEAVRTWEDNLRDALIDHCGEEKGLKLYRRFGECFPAAYAEDFDPVTAVDDIEHLLQLDQAGARPGMKLFRPADTNDRRLHFKVYRKGEPIPLSDALPLLENMGLKVIAERPYRMRMAPDQVWIQDFEIILPEKSPVRLKDIAGRFTDAFAAVWQGEIEDDSFNRLILEAGLDWRSTSMLRAYCRYLLQTGIPYSQAYMEEVLLNNAEIARLLADKFGNYFDPGKSRSRQRKIDEMASALDAALDAVSSQDEDRILRAFRGVIRATLRTNYYQCDDAGRAKPYMSFKLDAKQVPELPLPRPEFEIFVYSPRVEGVHLRGGKVARGGLRWSDRREDFRTEVLGLMKAQNVKNTLIVPVGAKGGFVCKQLPAGERDTIQAEVIDCYKTFIRGLLDITDNLVDGAVVAPPDVRRRDDDDYYLVVAADKGTATFSDIANAVAAEYDFWLGDAFASGGSAGYDHKKMGITARGAWEAVKRHFRELAVDVQSQPFTVAGIGDMSGDVFGNGMLQSRQTRLLAAFNHLHIFIDPNPDPAVSYEERQRLFELSRSGWTDYDADLISPGGGVFSRADKRIQLSPEMQQMLGSELEEMTPQELIRAILTMPVDLLWNGGIGTYVKASSEANSEAGDRSNDPVRVDASELRCKVVGEGGNLGITQLGRIEYALAEGRINTDFIDNSAGVDTSDREVNIKILLNLVAEDRRLTTARRDKLLAGMTDEVAALVLRNNYLQTQAISMMETHAVERLNEHAFVLRALERAGRLNRALEFLPDDEMLEERRRQRMGFTRPELSLLVSYSKIALYDELIRSNVPEDRYLARELQLYFPHPLQRRYSETMPKHPLSREIIATLVSNSIVNRMGPVFVLRMQEETGADVGRIARAYAIVREVFGIRTAWTQIENIDNVIHANVQYSMMFQTTRLLRYATMWLLQQVDGSPAIEDWVSRLQPGVRMLLKDLPGLLIGRLKKRYDETVKLYLDIGVPNRLATKVAALPSSFSALDIVEVARLTGTSARHAGSVYFELGMGLGLDWLRDEIEKLKVDGRWQAVARSSLRENLFMLHRRLTFQVLSIDNAGTPRDTVLAWLDKSAEKVSHSKHVLKQMRASGSLDFPTLSVALQEIRKLTMIT